MSNGKSQQQQIARNVAVHDRVARKYDAIHGEIFNPVEQTRLRSALTSARDAIRTGAKLLHALDFGCGSGNLTRHLLDLALDVTAADVSEGFLDLVRSRYPTERLSTLLMNGSDLRTSLTTALISSRLIRFFTTSRTISAQFRSLHGSASPAA